jgi:LysR family nitrogen assimilation transcriptional regulator
LDTEVLKVFMAVAEHGSLTKAAAAQDSTQSAISRQIAQLESDCGGKLFHRTGRGMMASELGVRMIPRVRRVLAETEGILAEAQALVGIPTGEVRLGLLPNVAAVVARNLYSEVKARFPQVKLVIFEGYTGQLEEWLDNGKIDLAVLFHYGKGIPLNQDLLASVDACLLSNSGDEMTVNPTVLFDKLEGLPLVLPSVPNALRATLDHLARRRRIKINPVVEANSIPVQLELVAGGGCYTIIPFFAVAKQVENGMLQASMIVNPTIDRSLTLQTTTQRPVTLACREISRVLRKSIEALRDGGTWDRVNRAAPFHQRSINAEQKRSIENRIGQHSVTDH